ncbi:MAG TPA: hypothetical protein VFN74_00945 [Chloroflexota bacterium]|nr:hypothetical protein [Chloroflexota bacterium]
MAVARQATGAIEATGIIGRSRGLAGLGSLPAFELPAVDGGAVRSWDYRSREHLVVVLAGTEPDGALLGELGRREREVRSEDAAVLVVMRSEADHATDVWERSGRPGRALVDAAGRAHARVGAKGEPELLVVDRDGTVYWRAALSEAPPERLLNEALSWLQYMNILEHECGTCVPAWPDEDLP